MTEPVPFGRSVPFREMFAAPPVMPAAATGFTEVQLPDQPIGLQRSVDGEAVREPVLQRAPAEPAPGEADPTTAVAAGGAAASGAPTPAAAPTTAAANVDELARRLYEPLAARLRAELWLDRERTGRSLT